MFEASIVYAGVEIIFSLLITFFFAQKTPYCTFLKMLAVGLNKEKSNKNAAEKLYRCWDINWRIKCKTGQMFSITNDCKDIF